MCLLQLCENIVIHLYLLIQIPQNNYSSIVVLEGDFSNSHNNVNKVINAEELEQLSVKQLNELFIGNLSLLQLSDGNTYVLLENDLPDIFNE